MAVAQGDEYLSPVSTTSAPGPIGPYSQAVAIEGTRMLFVSGQLPLVGETGEIAPGGISAQARVALENAISIVEASGGDRSNVAKVTLFVTNIDDGPAINEIYGDVFAPPFPARTTVEVSRLPRASLIEVDVVAALPSRTD